MRHLCYAIAAMMFISACSKEDDFENEPELVSQDFEISTFEDSRDGKTYDIVKIGSQVWFAENLSFEIENDASLCYENSSSNCFTQGRLYRGDDVLLACPAGWHVPSEEEWNTLIEYMGGSEIAEALFAPDAEIFDEKVNFNLLPSGRFYSSVVGFEDINQIGYYWTSTEGVSQFSETKFVQYIPGASLSFDQSSVGRNLSCRCVQN